MLNESWNEFNNQVVPDGASDSQRTDMKLAFFSGAFAAITTLAEASGSEGSDVSSIAKAMYDECHEFLLSYMEDANAIQ